MTTILDLLTPCDPLTYSYAVTMGSMLMMHCHAALVPAHIQLWLGIIVMAGSVFSILIGAHIIVAVSVHSLCSTVNSRTVARASGTYAHSA